MISFWSLKYLALHNLTLNEHTTPEDYERVPWSKQRHLPTEHHRYLYDVPESLDLRSTNLIGSVHDQSYCNSCWAFAAAGSIDFWAKKQRPGAEVDVQNILDCAPNTYGCRGGLMENVFEYDQFYPLTYSYNAKTEKCTPSNHGVRVNSFIAIENGIEDSLPYMLNKWGPVTVAVDFSKQYDYKGGLIKASDCNHNAKHAVLVVGYTPDFWIIKNSKGSDWGENGYAQLQRYHGACGLETYAAVATGVTIH